MKYYVNLKNEEWNVLQNLIFKSKMEEVISLDNIETFGDYFYDMDEDIKLPFTEGLEILANDIGVVGYVYAEFPKTERDIVEDIYKKYCLNKNVINFVKNVNKTLDNKE